MRKENLRKIIIALVVVGLASGFVLFGNKSFKGEYKEYHCDVKSLFHLSTTIEIDKDGKNFCKVKGNIFKFITDPLTMYDLEDNEIAYANDAYHFISQDSHTIYINDKMIVEMVGLVDFLGESYDIYNKDKEKIANVTFNMFNTSGDMYDEEGNLIADFRSKLFFRDFDVRISDKCALDEKTVLMIFASYYSDQAADSAASNSNSSKKKSD